MEFVQCNVCFNEYTEETWVPKVLECGHSLCVKCLTSILQSQKSCPTCRATLSRNIEEYPTNFGLLGISKSWKEKRNLDFLDACTLETMKNELESKKKILEKLIAERDEITRSIERTKASMQKLLTYTKKLFEANEIKALVPDIEECLEKVNKSLNYSWETDKDMLHSKNYDNSRQFLSEIVRRLHGGKRVYTCKRIDDLGEWKYGEVIYSEHENLLNIHCLSSSVFDPGASLVLFKDVTNCISSRKDIFPLIEFGNQKLRFTLTDDWPLDALRCLKLCTGEEGCTIKGLDSRVDSTWGSENLNICVIDIPTKDQYLGYEDVLHQYKECEAKKGEVTLHCELHRVYITKWPKDEEVRNLVGKLHENFKIDFDQIEEEPKVTDSGISLVVEK